MRGNGVVAAGESLQSAVVLTWYLEDAARVELAALSAGLAHAAPANDVCRAFRPENARALHNTDMLYL